MPDVEQPKHDKYERLIRELNINVTG